MATSKTGKRRMLDFNPSQAMWHAACLAWMQNAGYTDVLFLVCQVQMTSLTVFMHSL
jgi:hypothetical protein